MAESISKEDIETESDRYFTFVIGGEMFAIEITESTGVREVLNNTDITEVPGLPACLPGLINVRGSVVSTIDLSGMLGIKTGETKTCSSFVIVEMNLDGQNLQLAIIADSVREVADFSSLKIDPAPALGTNMNPEYAAGLAQLGNECVIILCMEKIVTDIENMITGVPNETSG